MGKGVNTLMGLTHGNACRIAKYGVYSSGLIPIKVAMDDAKSRCIRRQKAKSKRSFSVVDIATFWTEGASIHFPRLQKYIKRMSFYLYSVIYINYINL